MGLFVVYRLLKLFYVGCKCREFDMVPKLAASFDVHGLYKCYYMDLLGPSGNINIQPLSDEITESDIQLVSKSPGTRS